MAEEERAPNGSPWRGIVGIVLIVAVVLGVLFMVHQLQHAAAIQDCVASGRTNCAPIQTGKS